MGNGERGTKKQRVGGSEGRRGGGSEGRRGGGAEKTEPSFLESYLIQAQSVNKFRDNIFVQKR